MVSLLPDLHQKLDAAVAHAYGWPVDPSGADILDRLVALNHERAAEEAQGHIRWLRPGYQAVASAPGPSNEPPKGKSIQKRRTAE